MPFEWALAVVLEFTMCALPDQLQAANELKLALRLGAAGEVRDAPNRFIPFATRFTPTLEMLVLRDLLHARGLEGPALMAELERLLNLVAKPRESFV